MAQGKPQFPTTMSGGVEESGFEDLLRRVASESEPFNQVAAVLGPGSELVGGRLRIVRVVGRGGMGTVYEAWDAERGCSVALKSLNNLSATGIYLIKNEFRHIADLRSEHLVQLHHFFFDAGNWFFTMDLVEGVPFLQWVRPRLEVEEARLRRALLQLLAAIEVIHEAGKLHRDLKPSNVLVKRDGTVVVLDFGLIADHVLGGVGQTIPNSGVTGTPAYMAPEQAASGHATPATDLYAIGAMLFEALSGHVPYRGTAVEIMLAKQLQDAPRPHSTPSTLDLEEICSSLLARDPALRPSLPDVRARLDATPVRPSHISMIAPSRLALVGRNSELSQLRAAYRSSLAGSPVIACIGGESGIGKTALCNEFKRELADGGQALLLAARCYERESIPFKAIDPLIDELSRKLLHLPPEQVSALLPRDAFALVKLFPVLARVPAFAGAPGHDVLAPGEVRRRAIGAFLELLARVRDRRPVVILLDDLHWVDVDSVAFLRSALVDRNPSPTLIIVSYRDDGSGSQPLLDGLWEAARSNALLSLVHISLGPLDVLDSQYLAEQLLGDAAPEVARAVASECSGNPFFATELARFATTRPEEPLHAPSLDALIKARVETLTPAARSILELLAAVGRPLPCDCVTAATGGSHRDVDELRSAHLLRTSEHAAGLFIDCYHDGIRERIAQQLTPEARVDVFSRLAAALSARAHPDAELLSRCHEAAGDRAAAARCALKAAEYANNTLAFDRAAELFRRALDLGCDEWVHNLVRLGCALQAAGRGAEAAGAYRRAAEASHGDARLELLRRAAEQLLATGHTGEGMQLTRALCRDVALGFPSSEGRALLSLGWSQLRLRARRRESQVRTPRESTERDRLRLRTARTIVSGLIGYAPLHAASLAARHLLLADESGDVAERVRGLGFNAYFLSLMEHTSTLASTMLAQMQALADADGRQELVGFSSLMIGTSAFNAHRSQEAHDYLDRALRELRGCEGVEWEVDAANVYQQLTSYEAGNYLTIAQTAPTLIEEALRRRRVWAAAMLGGFAGMTAWLVPNDLDGYRRVIEEVKQSWQPMDPPSWPDYVLLVAESRGRIYSGDAQAGFALYEAQAPAYARSQLVRAGGAGRDGYVAHRGKCAAAALRAKGPLPAELRSRALAAIQGSLRILRRATNAKSLGVASSLDAALALARGDAGTAAKALRLTVVHFERAGSYMLAAAARRRLGQLVGGSEGAELSRRGDDFMDSQRIVDREALTEVSCPGCRV
ncbi:MAG TPA: protein kinase [Polyangiales bacterium]|nr:protein kinase [Polyangiales bacterium]